VTTVPTETVTRWVQKDSAGNVIAVLNDYAATQLNGVEEAWEVPEKAWAEAFLLGIDGVGAATRPAEHLIWDVTPTRGANAARVAARVQEITGWRSRVSPSGGCVFVWPPATPVLSTPNT
jgi:hypothetical protein